MRKSHTKKVADRRKKRQRRWMMHTYQGILNILRETKKFEYIEKPSPPWSIKGYAFIRENASTIFDGFFEEKSRAYAKDAAEKAFIGPIINTSPDYEVFGVDPARVCPECDGTGWSYHEHLPIERHVGCEDCGGCGDERGTGIIP